MKNLQFLIIIALILLQSCVAVRADQKDNGKHKGWTQNTNNPHHPNTTNPGHSSSKAHPNNGKGSNGKSYKKR